MKIKTIGTGKVVVKDVRVVLGNGGLPEAFHVVSQDDEAQIVGELWTPAGKITPSELAAAHRVAEMLQSPYASAKEQREAGNGDHPRKVGEILAKAIEYGEEE